MGVLDISTKLIHKEPLMYYCLSKDFKNDNGLKLANLYESILLCRPLKTDVHLPKFQTEVRRLLSSDLLNFRTKM